MLYYVAYTAGGVMRRLYSLIITLMFVTSVVCVTASESGKHRLQRASHYVLCQKTRTVDEASENSEDFLSAMSDQENTSVSGKNVHVSGMIIRKYLKRYPEVLTHQADKASDDERLTRYLRENPPNDERSAFRASCDWPDDDYQEQCVQSYNQLLINDANHRAMYRWDEDVCSEQHQEARLADIEAWYQWSNSFERSNSFETPAAESSCGAGCCVIA